MLDRLRGMLSDAGHAVDVVEAVLAQRPTRIDLVPARLAAVREFQALPEALALAAANKRIGNILKKADEDLPEPDIALLEEDAEKALFERVVLLIAAGPSHVANEDYADALKGTRLGTQPRSTVSSTK
jgi:glycyl-tRNA synthetase beta chain